MPHPPEQKNRSGPLATPGEVRLHLIAAARAGRSVTYSELLEQLGYSFSRPKMRQLCAILSAVDQEAEARGEPELAVLVVRQSDGIPGQGWWVEQTRHRSGTTAERRRMSRPPRPPGAAATFGEGRTCSSAPTRGVARARGYTGPWEGAEAAGFIASVQAEAFAFWQCQSGTDGRADPG